MYDTAFQKLWIYRDDFVPVPTLHMILPCRKANTVGWLPFIMTILPILETSITFSEQYILKMQFSGPPVYMKWSNCVAIAGIFFWRITGESWSLKAAPT